LISLQPRLQPDQVLPTMELSPKNECRSNLTLCFEVRMSHTPTQNVCWWEN
jgi:hypothetical protein